MRAYWWRRRSNFGDELNSWLLDRLGAPFDWAAPEDADLVICGSVLEHLPAGWTGTVCGAGMLRETSHVDLSHANVLAVRGHLTAQHARGVPRSVVLGDPGLLVSRWVPQTVTKYDLGVVPHWSDTELHHRFPYGRLIDVRQPPAEVIRDIARCKRIVASSLHGIIVADSFSIPRRAELFRQATVEGGDFKFRDYASVFNTHPHFGEFWRAPYDQVEHIRNQLRGVLARATNTATPLAEVDPPPDIPHKKGRRPQISLLVPYRRDNEDTEHRNRLWDWLSQYWQANLPQAEIIVGHDGAWPYSKCRSVNWAAERARGKVLAILDADAYLDAKVVQRCADQIIAALKDDRKLWYVPYRKLHRLNEQFTVQLLNDDPTLPYSIASPPKPEWLEPGTNTAVNYGYLYGAMAMIMPTEAFFTVGGMDGRFMGWGGEDVSFLKSLDTLYGLHEVTENDICHMWHLRPGHDWKTRLWIGQGAGLTNSRLSQRYSVASGEPEWMRGVINERIKATPLSRSYLLRKKP